MKTIVLFCTLCLSAMANAQVVTLWPGSVIAFASNFEGATKGGCPNQSGAYSYLFLANGLALQQQFSTFTVPTVVDGPRTTTRRQYRVSTIEPSTGRIRYWLITDDISTLIEPNFWRYQCGQIIQLEGDNVHDSMVIDIGVRVNQSDRGKSGQYGRFQVLPPFYCTSPSKVISKETSDETGQKIPDCKALGISIEYITQTVNVFTGK